MQYLKKKPETAVLLLLLGLVVLAGIALAVLTASNRKAEQAASEAADGSIPVLAIPSDTVRKIQMEARSGTLTLAYADGSWSLAEDPDYHLDESSCNAMLTAVSALNAKRELQEAAGEDYGFSAPQATVTITTDIAEALRGADAVYTDVWASMGMEAETEKRARDFADYQVNAAVLKLAKPDAIFLHCLPAHRGSEVTDEVMDGPQSVVFDEAENRLHAQKAVLALLMGAR